MYQSQEQPHRDGRPTARELLTYYFGSAHAEHAPVRWDAAKGIGKDSHEVTVECSCGKVLGMVALGQVVERLKVGFRNVRNRPLS